jgi:hypothetical protein
MSGIFNGIGFLMFKISCFRLMAMKILMQRMIATFMTGSLLAFPFDYIITK